MYIIDVGLALLFLIVCFSSKPESLKLKCRILNSILLIIIARHNMWVACFSALQNALSWLYFNRINLSYDKQLFAKNVYLGTQCLGIIIVSCLVLLYNEDNIVLFCLAQWMLAELYWTSKFKNQGLRFTQESIAD